MRNAGVSPVVSCASSRTSIFCEDGDVPHIVIASFLPRL
jgi:hypothetical protein